MAVTAGLGVTLPAEKPGQSEIEGSGMGGFAEANYYYRFSEWVRPTVYSGLHITAPRKDCGSGVADCDISAQLLFFGGQLRAIAPIPDFGVFLELGVGASLGNFSVRSGDVDQGREGVAYHVPVALGVMLGEHHQFEIALRYLVHPGLIVAGGIGIGLGFPLESSKPVEREHTRPPLRLQRPSGDLPGVPGPQ